MLNQFKKNLKIIRNKQKVKLIRQPKNWKFNLIHFKRRYIGIN